MTDRAVSYYDLLVIGGGPGGMSAARFARSRDREMSIGMIRKQEQSVVPCSQPYAIDGTICFDDFLKSDEEYVGSASIELHVGEATAIDPVAHRVSVSGLGTEEVGYNTLLACPGAEPIVPPVENADMPGTFVVKDAPDIKAIIDAAEEAETAVVVGGGYIGLEMSVVLSNAGLDVHVVEMLPVCLGTVCSEPIARHASQELRDNGVTLHAGQAAEAVLGDDRVEAVRVGGRALEAEMVIWAVGVRANTKLFEDAGARVGEMGVVVDDRMRTSLPDVYAVGDCIQHRNFITGAPDRGPLATNAVVQGKCAAINITGGFRTFPGFINASLTRLWENAYGATGLNVERAAAAGIKTVVGEVEAYTREPIFPGAGRIVLIEVFDARTHRLIGAECYGREGVAERIDMLTLAIQHGLTMEDLATMQFTGHPPQTDVPSRMITVNAAEQAMRKAGVL